MSDYPKWWDTTVTVYNRYEDPQTQVITWYKTVLDNCFWKNNFQRLKVGQTEVETDSVICRIPINDAFKEKYSWINIPNYQMNNYFTLDRGDIIAKGNIEEDIVEYQSGKRSSDFIAKYKSSGCMVIDSVNINDYTGVGIPHYHVEGV